MSAVAPSEHALSVFFVVSLTVTAFAMVLGERPASAATVKVACVGDSITEGSMASTPAHAYPEVLGTLAGAGWNVSNFGNSGKTMIKMPSDGASYWNQVQFTQSQTFAPDVVTLMLGTNDSKTTNWQGGMNTFETDYRAMVAVYMGLSSHPRIFLMLPPPALTTSYSIDPSVIQNQIIPIIRRIAQDNGLAVIDINAVISANQPKTLLSSDGIHPNDAGYQLIAQTVWNAIRTPAADGGVADAGTPTTTSTDAGGSRDGNSPGNAPDGGSGGNSVTGDDDATADAEVATADVVAPAQPDSGADQDASTSATPGEGGPAIANGGSQDGGQSPEAGPPGSSSVGSSGGAEPMVTGGRGPSDSAGSGCSYSGSTRKRDEGSYGAALVALSVLAARGGLRRSRLRSRDP